MAFQNPFVGQLPARPMNEGELVRALRLDLAAEEEATALYMAHADATGDDLVKMVLTSIADEERVHAGELQMLLDIITGNEFKLLSDGMKEVALKVGTDKVPQ
ncbi:MAG: Rubrerythrin [Candidatus Marinimicrobia bacterium]|nr:Rubrerythrin [Candidatus Neomarinimicrobiota bacterium]MDD5539101.1 Rubrerythrin [Candidatus Neomarinimicrobiota bacterium]